MKIATLYQKTKTALVEKNSVQINENKRFFTVMGALAVTAFTLAPGVAMAAPWDGGAEAVLSIFTGGLARTIAIISVIACGIAAMAGKLSWDWAIKIIVGIVLIFGSTAIVDFIISSSS